MSPSNLRIAILEADLPLTTTRAQYGSYGGIFTSLLHKAASAVSFPKENLEITGWDVVNVSGEEEEGGEMGGKEEEMGGMFEWKRRRGYPKVEDVDAVLITGSRFDAFSDEPWVVRLVEFTREALERGRPRVIGVCFGHQIVGKALGAKVARSESGAWETSVCRVTPTPKGRELFGGKEILNLFQMHKDLVYYYPEGVQALGSSDSCKVQGMYVPGKVMTVQGHPEFTEEIVRELLETRREQNVFSEAIYAEAMGRVGEPHDGVLVAGAFLRFLME